MLRIILIRPGSTEYDQQGRIQGRLDIPLDDQGKKQASRMAMELGSEPIETVYCAACQSAEQTGRVIADALDVKLKRLDKLENLNQGLWQGMLVEDIHQKQPTVYRQWADSPENVCPPQGEMLAEAQKRLDKALSKLVRKHREGTIALVLPQPLAALAHTALCHDALVDLWKANGQGTWETILLEEPAAAR